MTGLIRLVSSALLAIGAVQMSTLFARGTRRQSRVAAYVTLVRLNMENARSAPPKLGNPAPKPMSWLHRLLSLAGTTLTTTSFKARLLQTCALVTLGALSLMLALGASLTLSVATALAMSTLLITIVLALLYDRADRMRNQLLGSYPSLLERLGMLVGSGCSLMSALELLAADATHPWSPRLSEALNAHRQGYDIVEELTRIASYLRFDAFNRLIEILTIHVLSAELSELLTEELARLRRRRRFELSEALEKRSQLVWVPVSIAILIPGSILLIIPLMSALKFFAGV